MLDSLDRRIINELQGNLPICEAPYAAVAERLGTSEGELIERIQRLLDEKVLSRFGPMYHAERLGGGLTLAAMAIPDNKFDEVAEQVNALPEVAHNYQRDHELNMWFVLATETPERIDEMIEQIEERTGYPVYNMPKEREYYIGLRFEA